MPDVEAGGGWLVGPVRYAQVPNVYATGYYTITTSTTGNWSPWLTNSNSTTGNGWTTLTWGGQRLVLAEDDPVAPAIEWIEQTAEELARRQANRERLARDREQHHQARATAIARGEELLLSLLDENQREAYRLDGTFAVIGSHGTVYRIHRGTSGNIEWVKPDGTSGGRLCAHPNMRHEWIPTEDVMLAQMLALTTDEREFLRVANVHAGVRPPILV